MQKNNNKKTVNTKKKELNDIYLKILNKIAKKDNFTDWMEKPFNAFGKSIATNGYCLVATPMCGEFINRDDIIKSIYPFEFNLNKKIKLQEIKDKLALIPIVDCYDEKEEECDACDGSGTVDFEFEYSRKTYEMEGECPVCEGEGTILQKSKTPNGKKELDYNKLIQIGLCAFHLERIEEIIYIAESIGVDEVVMVYQKLHNRPSLFLIGDIEYLAMSTIYSDISSIAQKID